MAVGNRECADFIGVGLAHDGQLNAGMRRG